MTVTATALSSASLIPTAHAQQAAPNQATQLTPVQPIRSTPQPLARSPHRPSPSAAAASGNTTLRWQSSSKVAPATPAVQAAPAVARVAYVQDAAAPAPTGSFALPRHGGGPSRTQSSEGTFAGDGALPPRTALAPAADPFLDPFNDGAGTAPAPRPQPERLSVPRGESRFIGELAPPDMSAAPEAEPLSEEPVPTAAEDFDLQPPVEDAPNGRLQFPNPFSPGQPPEGQRTVPSPSDQQSVVQDPAGGELRDRNERAVDSGRRPSQRTEPSCDELRERIARRTIRKVTLDISPPFRPDILEQDEYAKLRAEFIESQAVREWRSLDGRLLGSGRLIDMAYEDVIIEAEDGTELALPMADLSEPDLEYVTSAWGLPRECQLPQIAFQPRQWLPTKMTWKASELCHKPLYFEEVNLERYGHTAGPFAQPVISTAHFFFNIAVLPYKMGIHPPNECQYALGYYRPGNCAPWIVPPVPLSLRGAVAQTAFVGGMVALIP